MSMPVITLTSASKAHPPEIKNVREASFSSYLDGAEQTFVLKLTDQGLTSTISTTHDHNFLGKNKIDDREIDVFDAEKYFNEGLNRSPKVGKKNISSHQPKKDDPLAIFAIKEPTPVATLSIRSGSSWSSRRALLHTIPRNQHPRKANKKSFLASIGCNCSCNDKNSVEIDDYMPENCSSKSISTGLVNAKSKQADKTSDHLVRKSQSDYTFVKFDEPELRVNSEGHFSFPVFNSKTGNQQAKMQLQEGSEEKSLEIASSQIQENGKKNCLSLEEKLTMMSTWDAIAPGVAEEIKIPSISSEMHNDSDSDTSSDLFEIESLSKGNPFLSRQASDGCITPTNCYAPSEASIEWSVITASAADFDDLRTVSTTTTTMPCTNKVSHNSKIKEIPKLRPRILSGCKSDKAVRVVGDAHKPNEQGISHSRRHLMGESFIPMTRFHDESNLAASNRHQSFDARVPPQSRSGNTAHLLYT